MSTIYSWLAPAAEDFVCAPALQAYVERIFSVCVCAAFCEAADAVACSSHLRACLKLNQKVSVCYGWVCFVRTEQCVCV